MGRFYKDNISSDKGAIKGKPFNAKVEYDSKSKEEIDKEK